MRSEKLNIDQPGEPIDAAEARMRLALGLTGKSRPATHGAQASAPTPAPQSGPASPDAPRPRRRFAQDGDVPVVVIGRREGESGGENRFATITNELRDERTRRARAERALEDANLAVQSLQTKLAHTEMACDEKLREAIEVRTQLEALRADDQEARKRAETRHAEATLAISVLERRIAELETAATQAPKPRPKADLFEDLAPEEPPAKATRGRPAAAAKAAKPAKAVAAVEPEEPAAEDEQPIEWWLPSFRATRTRNTARKPKSR